MKHTQLFITIYQGMSCTLRFTSIVIAEGYKKATKKRFAKRHAESALVEQTHKTFEELLTKQLGFPIKAI